jgi:hypothetical protein
MLARKNWILHIIDQYKTNLELAATTCSSFEKGLSFNVTALGLSVELDELELMQLFLDAGANIEAQIADGQSALELAIGNLQKAPRKSRYGIDRREEAAFRMLIEALKSRGLHSIADQAVVEVSQHLPKTDEEVPRTAFQTTGISKNFCMMLDYRSGQQPAPDEELFHEAIAGGMPNIRAITALTVDGMLIRFGFLFSICFVISFEVWRSLNDLISGKRPSLFVLRLIAVALLGLIIALNFRHTRIPDI